MNRETKEAREEAIDFLEPFRYGIDYFIIVKDNNRKTGGEIV